MKETYLGVVSPYHFGDKLLLAISDKYMKLTNGKPLEFQGKINEKNQLVLSAQLPC